LLRFVFTAVQITGIFTICDIFNRRREQLELFFVFGPTWQLFNAF